MARREVLLAREITVACARVLLRLMTSSSSKRRGGAEALDTLLFSEAPISRLGKKG